MVKEMSEKEMRQIILLNPSGLPIAWRSYSRVEPPSKENQFLMTGFLSAITSFAEVLTKGGRLESFVIDERVFYIRANTSIIAVFEGSSDLVDLIWEKIKDQYDDLKETFANFDALLNKELGYREDFGLIIDTIVTSTKADLENLSLIKGTSLLKRLRKVRA